MQFHYKAIETCIYSQFYQMALITGHNNKCNILFLFYKLNKISIYFYFIINKIYQQIEFGIYSTPLYH